MSGIRATTSSISWASTVTHRRRIKHLSTATRTTTTVSPLASKSPAALTCLLTLSSTAPASKHGQPNFLIDNNFTITAGGTHGNQGAHVITPATVSRAISISNSLATRDGVGSVVTGAGLDWYNSDFSTGNSGYDDPQYYYCFKGPASNFPPLANWMNFYDMFDLNQNDQMVYEESGPI